MMIANPIDYVGGNLPGKHVVLLHEDPSYAQLIEFSFLLQGLERNRPCVFLTYRDKAAAQKELKERGLVPRRLQKSAQLHISSVTTEPFDFWHVIRELQEKSQSGLSFRHCRVLWRFDKKRYGERQLFSHIEQDGRVQSVLEAAGRSGSLSSSSNNQISSNFEGSILCSYPVDAMSLAHPGVLRHHLNNHGAVILAPKRGRGTVLQSNGLSKSDMEQWIRNKLEV